MLADENGRDVCTLVVGLSEVQVSHAASASALAGSHHDEEQAPADVVDSFKQIVDKMRIMAHVVDDTAEACAAPHNHVVSLPLVNSFTFTQMSPGKLRVWHMK